MKVESGYRLLPPLGSPSTIGKVMTKCWLVPGTPGSTHYVPQYCVCVCVCVCMCVCVHLYVCVCVHEKQSDTISKYIRREEEKDKSVG